MNQTTGQFSKKIYTQKTSHSCPMNTLRPRQTGWHFTDDSFKCIFFNENVWILIKISLKLVSMGPINNIPALVQIMAWHWPGAKPLSEPVMVNLLMHICVTLPQWVMARCGEFGGIQNSDFSSFLDTEMAEYLELHPRRRQGLVNCTRSMSWLLMNLQHKEPWHQWS